ncbi:MAG: DUF5107 domain-containing protein, partial [Akkermansiaceae bacterium]|nr:DUF5107 domain-containing protein [Verrucomicrobiales bacterium]
DRIAEKAVERKWQAVRIENEFLRVLVLPEIGGRIHAIHDKTNGYDLIYHQHVIKPALVGLAGPWISGGIEFNWPQHHRPATFLPVDFEIEKQADGSITVWCSDHDPMSRMKGMHGVCLHPGKAYVELKVRAYNRTPFAQTFLWWANVATRVHEAYQSFFPPDVYYVADHARRSMSEYPLCTGSYYGVNYGERGRKGIPAGEVPSQFVPPHAPSTLNVECSMLNVPHCSPNDLSFYANIPVPTSYMCMGSKQDFFGGYDFFAQAGIIHFANHHISPGKKQWTWGNHEFGYAWDRNLTDRDERNEFGPYIEIMAGVYTDNQPDFSFLQPGETKAWSQYWYPIQKIGPAQNANLDAAVSLKLEAKQFFVGVSVTREFPKATIRLESESGAAEWDADLTPGKPFVLESVQPRKAWKVGDAKLCVFDRQGNEIISYEPQIRIKSKVPPPATEPPRPRAIPSTDELFITGLHLDQYRHATRCPTEYWGEALRRDPLDARCNNALGLWHLRRGEFTVAEKHFRQAIQRLTRRNSNPADGEAFYNLGLCLRHLDRDDEAYEAFYKACWNQAWMAAGYHALAELDCTRKNWETALDHLNCSLRYNTDNLRARNLKVIVFRKLNRQKEAEGMLDETLALDPLDWWARQLKGQPLACDLQTALDLAHDFARAGLFAEAAGMLGARLGSKTPTQHPEHFDTAKTARPAAAAHTAALPDQSWGAWPLVQYTLGWLHEQLEGAPTSTRFDEPIATRHPSRVNASLRHYRAAAALPADYCFPARLEEIGILEAAMHANPKDARAPYYLGNLLYDRRRHDEAIQLWEQSVRLDGNFSIVWRNLGIGYFNIRHRSARARTCYDQAFRVNSSDARLLYERDQLWKRLGEKPQKRLRELERNFDLVQQRDDLSVEICALYNQTGQSEKALELLARRSFQPWEGGEGGPLGQHVRTHLALGRAALQSARRRGEKTRALESEICQTFLASAVAHFRNALNAPRHLGEAKHLLANQSDLHYWLGAALELAGESNEAHEHWLAAATFKGDFQEMSVRAFSEMTFYSARALERLGKKTEAKALWRALSGYARQLQKSRAKIDYFATSLPAMLLFDDDIQFRQESMAQFLQAQAQLGLGKLAKSKSLLAAVLRRDPSHALAHDFLAAFFQSKGRS